MESSPQQEFPNSESDTTTDSTLSVDKGPSPAKPSIDPSSARSLFQAPLLVFAVLGILFAGWSMWTQLATEKSVFQPVETLFDVEVLTIPRELVMGGGVPKDGIPALTHPEFVSADTAEFMEPTHRVAGVVIDGEARAYPLKIMNFHEIVNDKIGETAFAVTYCPLCDSVAVYNRKGAGGDIELGVSGFLYNSNVLMYDRTGSNETDGLWSQMMSQSVSGPLVNEKLVVMPFELTTWKDWQQRYPQTKVLSEKTGHTINYNHNPYAGHLLNDELPFPVDPIDLREGIKTPVLGIWAGDQQRAYPLSAFIHLTEPQELEQELGGKKFTLLYSPQYKSIRVVKSEAGLSWIYSFWFAWYAFHPETELYSVPTSSDAQVSPAEPPAASPAQAEKP